MSSIVILNKTDLIQCIRNIFKNESIIDFEIDYFNTKYKVDLYFKDIKLIINSEEVENHNIIKYDL